MIADIRRSRFVHAGFLAAFFPLVLSACGEGQQQAAPPAPVVTVANPVKRDIIEYDEYVGRFIAIDSVEVRARVSGYLQKIHFTDGQLVKEGDLLFTIDPRPFENSLNQARANLTQARAALSFAEADLQRGQQLVRDKTITEQIFEQRLQSKRTAEASVLANEAIVKQAELDLEFTALRAPVSGRIGDRRVSPGNLVTGGASGATTLLATIVSTDPIHFEFTFDEASYLRYERMSKTQADIATRGASTEVWVKLIDEPDFGHTGRMDFIDNVIDKTSGTIRGRASFANSNNIFTPGMFGRIRVPGSPRYEALVVPDSAIGSDQAKKFVYVVGEDNSVSRRYVTLGPLWKEKERVIRTGLAAEDRIVVNGLMRIRPGMKVQPQTGEPSPAAGNASGRGS